MNKKLIVLTLLISLFVSVFGNFKHTFADTISSYDADAGEYPYACTVSYEVDSITDDGSFKLIDCYDNFASAKAKMKENPDFVVRNIDGKSPSKIVAMNDGLAYSYNRSASDVVINIYEGVKGLPNNTQTYVDRYFQMNYVETNYVSEVSGYKGTGYVHIVLNGFDGYADLEYVDLVPAKFIDKKLPIYLGGSYGNKSVAPYKVICEPDYYKIEKNGNYDDLVLYYHNAYPTNASKGNFNAECWHMSIGSANDFKFMNKGTTYYSDDGCNFYDSYKINDRNYFGTGYNYYQFLPLRTKTKVSAATLDNFLLSVKGNNTTSIMKGKGSVFMEGQNTYGSNATIVYAMACWESGYGLSSLALSNNNLFGWRAYDSNPGYAYEFKSVNDCILEHAGGNLRDYADINVKWFNGAYLGNKGSGFNLKYASDPYWGAGISSICYRIDKYANGNDGNLTDYNSYNLGIVKNLGAQVYLDSACSKSLFRCKYSDTRNLNYFVTILEDTGNAYKIQLSNPINNNALVSRVDGKVAYNWNTSVGYIKKSDVDFVKNNGTIVLTNSPITIIDDIKFNETTLNISGIGIITNCDFTNTDNVSHKINIYKLSNSELVESVSCTNTDTSWYSINDGNKYTYGGFNAEIDLSGYENDSYYFSLITTANCNGSSISKEVILNSAQDDLYNNVYENNEKSYKLTENDVYKYRLELDINTIYEDLDFASINKPSIKTSLATIDVVTYDDSTMEIEGVGMIHYLNYNTTDNKHTLYLVNDENIYELNTQTLKSEFDFKSFYNSTYNMDYICYTASIDCKEIETGNYRIIMKIEVGDNVDYIELVNDYDYQYNGLDINKLSCSFSIDNIRSRMLFNINNTLGE